MERRTRCFIEPELGVWGCAAAEGPVEKEDWLVSAVCGAGNTRELATERGRAREGYEPTAAVAVRLATPSQPGQAPYVVPEQGGRLVNAASLPPLELHMSPLELQGLPSFLPSLEL